MTLNKCEGNAPSAHECKVFGICTKCGENVCAKCSAARHFDHFHALYSYDLECAYLVNFITRLKNTTQKAIKTRNKLLPVLQFNSRVEELQQNVHRFYAGFRTFLESHRDSYVARVQDSSMISRLRHQHASLTTNRIVQMERLRDELRAKSGALMNASISGKYFARLEELHGADKYRSQVDALVESQQRETEAFYDLVLRFKEVFVSANPAAVQSFCKVSNIDKLDGTLYKALRVTGVLAAFTVTSRKLKLIQFSDYTPPFNASILETYGVAYIIGGCWSDGTPAEEKLYTSATIMVDLDSGMLVSKPGMINRRMCFGSAALNGDSIFVVGGYNHTRAMNECERFDCKKATWGPVAALNVKKSSTGVCVLGGRLLYCFGGYLNDAREDTTIEVMNLTTCSKWELVALAEGSKWFGRQNPGVVAISDGEILVFGGMSENKRLGQSLLFRVEKGEFEEVADMKFPDTLLGCKPLLFRKKVYAFGCHENYLQIFDVVGKTWDMATVVAMGA